MNKMMLAVPAIALMVMLAGCGERDETPAKKVAKKPEAAKVVKKAPAKELATAHTRAMKYPK